MTGKPDVSPADPIRAILLSSSRAPLLAPSPLRTGLESFPSSGSSTQKRPHEKRGRGLIQYEADLLDTGLLPIRTAVENPPTVREAAPTDCAVVICFASFIGSSRGLELEHQRVVSSVSGEVMLSPLGRKRRVFGSPNFVLGAKTVDLRKLPTRWRR